MLDALKFLWDVTEGLPPFVREPARIMLVAAAIAASLAVLAVPVLKVWQALRGAPGAGLPASAHINPDTIVRHVRKVPAKARQPIARFLLTLAARRYGQASTYADSNEDGSESFLRDVADNVELRSFLRRFCADVGIITGHPGDFVERLRHEINEGATLSSGAIVGMMQSSYQVAPIAQYLALGVQLYAGAGGASEPLLRYFLGGENNHADNYAVGRLIYLDQLKKDPEQTSGLTRSLHQIFGG